MQFTDIEILIAQSPRYEEEKTLSRENRARLGRVYMMIDRIEQRLKKRMPVEYQNAQNQCTHLQHVIDISLEENNDIAVTIGDSLPHDAICKQLIKLTYLQQAEEFLAGVRLPPQLEAKQLLLFGEEILREMEISSDFPLSGPIPLTRTLLQPN